MEVLRRTTKPKKKIRMVNYRDKNKAQRWGKVEKEKKDHLVVRDMSGEKAKVSKQMIIEEKYVAEIPKI